MYRDEKYEKQIDYLLNNFDTDEVFDMLGMDVGDVILFLLWHGQVILPPFLEDDLIIFDEAFEPDDE